MGWAYFGPESTSKTFDGLFDWACLHGELNKKYSYLEASAFQPSDICQFFNLDLNPFSILGESINTPGV